ncbi:MAG: VanZ family protein [Coriobacteriia bacterium]|nr:VanZ family protein [Coriobacteriia bacterium]
MSFLPVLGAALLVWVPWRVVLWRRGEKNRDRERVVAVLFAWALAVVALTLFPMMIILYDWGFHANLVPLVETVRMWHGATLRTSITNVGGNLAMFVPFGVLMPLLFAASRRPLALAAQAFVVTALIESVQWLSRSRIFDIDDLVLNTAGALVGLGLYHIAVRLVGRGERAQGWLARIVDEGGRSPLIKAALPVTLIAALTLPFAVMPVMSETMSAGTGPGSISADAISSAGGGRVVARAEWEKCAYILTVRGTGPGEVIALHDYLEVLPGRYSHGADAELGTGGEDCWGWSMTPVKVDTDVPRVIAYGTNRKAGAVRLDVVTTEGPRPVRWGGGEFLLASYIYYDRLDATNDGIVSVKLRFTDAKGRDVTSEFRTQ